MPRPRKSQSALADALPEATDQLSSSNDAIAQPRAHEDATAPELDVEEPIAGAHTDVRSELPIEDLAGDRSADESPGAPGTDTSADPASAGADEPDQNEPDPDVEAAPAEALPSLIEALLFVSDGPVELRSLARALGVATPAVESAIDVLRSRLDGRGLILQTGPEGAQLVTAPRAAQYVEAFLGLEQHRRLSNAALETLAIVAYRQPVTRSTIESIRGVSSDGAMQTLRARGLIEEAGRSQGPGRPTLFVTTQRFLEHFGLNGPHDLPELGDIELPPPDTSIPMPGLDGRPTADGPAQIDQIAEALSSLSAAARSLADPERRRPGATALLLPGPTLLSLPSPAPLPDGAGSPLPAPGAGLPWR